jgi:hypothetical protein
MIEEAEHGCIVGGFSDIEHGVPIGIDFRNRNIRPERGESSRACQIHRFDLFRLTVLESPNAFVDLVDPELQSRGVYKIAYREGTLREKLFPGRAALLHPTHPGASFRRSASPAAISISASHKPATRVTTF